MSTSSVISLVLDDEFKIKTHEFENIDSLDTLIEVATDIFVNFEYGGEHIKIIKIDKNALKWQYEIPEDSIGGKVQFFGQSCYAFPNYKNNKYSIYDRKSFFKERK